ncbi:MAG TPA: ATP-binding protein, partial [Polyangiaceae bacterium]
RMVRTLMGEGVRLETQLAEDLPTVRADSGGLEQVIMNLAVNARDAIPGNGRLTIATGVDGDRVLMRVSDNGVGMDSIALQRLFEPFFTTKATGKGTGLGLSTVFGIVKQSGGDIEVDSRLGYGTTFRIYLPIALGEGSSRPPLPAPTPLTGGHETVVVVEDEVALRDALVRLLTDLGYAVISAATGASTLEACVAHGGSVHLLVTDVVLPSLSGPEVARRLRMDHPRLKVLFMSGYTDTTAHPSVPVGGLGFLQKPFTPRTLAVRVRELLDTAP